MALTQNVTTPGGKLTVERYSDESYPGFTLYLDGQQCGVFEYNSVATAVQLHVWKRAGSEDDPDVTLTIKQAKE